MKLGTRLLQLTVDGTDRTAEVSNVRITVGDSDSDFVTFADAAAGGAKDYKLAFTAVQDPEAASLWDEVWSNAGDTVPIVIKPTGSAAASATEPWFEGSAVIKMPDGDLLGGEANASTTARFTFEAEWDFTAKPTRKVAP